MSRFLGYLALVLISFAGAELVFRILLFSGMGIGSRFRDPALYFNYFTDDRFWELNYDWDQRYGRSSAIDDPLLGWSQRRLKPGTYLSPHQGDLGNRRPVLLYGDSFAACTTRKCFERYFNEDPRFNRRCYFLNYAVGAHGVDQTYLVFHKSIGYYRRKRPIVIYSLLTQDLDRATLRIFTEQKPYFILDRGHLVLQGVPVDPSVSHYFRTHQPKVLSYLYLAISRWIRGKNGLRTDPENKPAIERIGRAILRQAIEELRASHTDFFFVVFVPNWWGEEEILQPDSEDWRLMTILSLLREEHVPYLVTRDVLRAGLPPGSTYTSVQKLFFKSDGHPNDRQNALIAAAIRKRLGGCYR